MPLMPPGVTPTPNFNISSTPTSPITVGTVVRLTASYTSPLDPTWNFTWAIEGPFSQQTREIEHAGPLFDLDTQALRAGAYTVQVSVDVPASATPTVVTAPPVSIAAPATGAGAGGRRMYSRPLDIILNPSAVATNDSGVVPVSLQRTATVDTPQQALWVVIRNRTIAIGWRRYKDFIDAVMCSDPRGEVRWKPGTIPFRGTEAYTILKNATDLFLMHEAGVLDLNFDLDPLFRRADPHGRLDPDVALDDIAAKVGGERTRFELEEGRRFQRRTVNVEQIRVLRDAYYNELAGESVLPYLKIIRDRLADIPLKGPDEVPANCYGILRSNLGGPVAMELIWSYWHEEGMLAQTLNAILARFQNRRITTAPGVDPLARFDLDPLRPLSNLFWGFAQDEIFRLTVKRRSFEYEHEYGLRLIGKAVPRAAVVDRRSKFLEAFHNLLYLCHVFFKEDDDTTIIADPFPVLNALRETHLVLAEGAHNQFGDLPSTARAEMLIMEWLLARPEIREFLGGRIMVPYEEEWMDRVDMTKSMLGWTDVTITHFRDLGVFGEQLVLAIRYGNWSVENDPQEAANWARYWRPEIQRYAHAYRSATGADLTERPDTSMPSKLLQQRLISQRRA